MNDSPVSVIRNRSRAENVTADVQKILLQNIELSRFREPTRDAKIFVVTVNLLIWPRCVANGLVRAAKAPPWPLPDYRTSFSP
jgi:hypothetical protein